MIYPTKEEENLRKGQPGPIGHMMTEPKTPLGRLLRTARLERGLREKEAAKYFGISQSMYSGYEIGRFGYLNPKLYRKAAKFCECAVYDIPNYGIVRVGGRAKERFKVVRPGRNHGVPEDVFARDVGIGQ